MALLSWRLFGGMQEFGEVDVDLRYDSNSSNVQDLLASVAVNSGSTAPLNLTVVGTLTENDNGTTITFTLTPGVPFPVPGNRKIDQVRRATVRGGQYSYNFSPRW